MVTTNIQKQGNKEMAENHTKFEPGALLHDAIMGAFRTSGSSCNAWCGTYGITAMTARNASLGLTRSPVGKKILHDMIEAAGPDLVALAYRKRVRKHLGEIEEDAA
ncbi:MAG: hypothetical protein COC12_12050 [Rhodobacteraceae bacterium]|nr:MAG: hypothetical protein COC12_12050 [Paracoccaceae bacterium]